MPTIRRIALYGALTVALALVLAGIPDLLRVLLDQVSRGSLALPRVARDDLSRALAFALVGGLLWIAIAWLMARRVRGDGPDALADRASPTRALVLTGTIVVLGSWAAWTGGDLLRALFRDLLDVPSLAWDRPDVRGLTATLVVLAGMLVPYVRWRIADHRLAPERLAPDAATRAALYGALAILGITWLVALRDLAEPALRILTGLPPAGLAGDRWWADPVATALAVLLVSAPAWAVLRVGADRMVRGDGPVAVAHRHARTRAAADHGVTASAVLVCTAALGSTLGELGARATGALESPTAIAGLAAIVGPVLVVLPLAGGGLWHAARARAEAWTVAGATGAAASVRISLHLVALGGLAWASWGLARLLVVALEPPPAVTGTVIAGGNVGLASVALAGGSALAGLAAWGPAWTWLERDRAADPVGRAVSLVRRGALATTLGASGLAAATAAAYVLYRVFRDLLGATPAAGDPATTSLAVLATGLLVLAYHAGVLWRDVRVAGAAGVRVGPAASETLEEELDLRLPPGTDVGALNARIRALLPPGSAMRIRHGGHA